MKGNAFFRLFAVPIYQIMWNNRNTKCSDTPIWRPMLGIVLWRWIEKTDNPKWKGLLKKLIDNEEINLWKIILKICEIVRFCNKSRGMVYFEAWCLWVWIFWGLKQDSSITFRSYVMWLLFRFSGWISFSLTISLFLLPNVTSYVIHVKKYN